jgi:hypothetical protein
MSFQEPKNGQSGYHWQSGDIIQISTPLWNVHILKLFMDTLYRKSLR